MICFCLFVIGWKNNYVNCDCLDCLVWVLRINWRRLGNIFVEYLLYMKIKIMLMVIVVFFKGIISS